MGVDDFEDLLVRTHTSPVLRGHALLTPGVVMLQITADGIQRVAQTACDVNERNGNDQDFSRYTL